jgi:hypothetical protein
MKKQLEDLLCEYLGELKNDIANEFDWIRKERLLQKEDAVNLLLEMEPKEKRLNLFDIVMQAMEKTQK